MISIGRDRATGATERYLHAVEPELWEVAHRLEAGTGAVSKREVRGEFTSCESGC